MCKWMVNENPQNNDFMYFFASQYSTANIMSSEIQLYSLYKNTFQKYLLNWYITFAFTFYWWEFTHAVTQFLKTLLNSLTGQPCDPRKRGEIVRKQIKVHALGSYVSCGSFLNFLFFLNKIVNCRGQFSVFLTEGARQHLHQILTILKKSTAHEKVNHKSW